MRIRPYRPDDAAALAELIRRSISALGARHYTPAQVAAWMGRAPGPAELHARLSDGRTALVAVDAGDGPLGLGDLEADGHIDLLYRAPEATARGAGSALCAAIEDLARGRGLGRLHVEASEGARRLLLGRGFRVVARRDPALGGVRIHNLAMEKDLRGP